MEKNYLEEWINHHKNLGFDKIVIYDNNDREGKYKENSEDLILVKNGIKEGFIEKFDIDGSGMQTSCYTACYRDNNRSYDWLFFLDIDEYLVGDEFSDVKKFLNQKAFGDYDIIHLPWKIYGDNDLVITDNDYSTKKRFTKESHKYFDRHNKIEVKSAIRGSLDEIFFSKNAHTVYSKKIKCCDNIGRPRKSDEPFSNNPVYRNAWINHYATRSLDEFFKTKLVRCGPNEHKAVERYNVNYYFKHNEINSKKLSYLKEKMNKEDFKSLKNEFISNFRFL